MMVIVMLLTMIIEEKSTSEQFGHNVENINDIRRVIIMNAIMKGETMIFYM